MSLSITQKVIVKTTFNRIADADLLATRFYARLFEIDPTTKSLFKRDMIVQRQKLIQTIAVVVTNLDNLNPLIPAIQSLGQRHITYGVQPQHWDSVGSALLWALEDALGSLFTSEVREAWAAAYTLIAQTALEAAAHP